MIFGKSVVAFLVSLFIAICVFFLAQWAIPLVFGLVGFHMPDNIINIFSLLVAAGCFYWGVWRGPIA